MTGFRNTKFLLEKLVLIVVTQLLPTLNSTEISFPIV